MTWYDTKVDGVSTLPAAEYNLMVKAIQNQNSGYYVYKDGSTYYAKNMATGIIDTSNTLFSTVMNSCIGLVTAGGIIQLAPGDFKMSSTDVTIAFGSKAIDLRGSGIGGLTPSDYVTRIIASSISTFADYFITVGTDEAGISFPKISNLLLDGNGASTVTPLGAIKINNCCLGIFENIHINDFYNVAAVDGTGARGIWMTTPLGSCYYNTFRNFKIRRVPIGIQLDRVVNGNYFYGGHIDGANKNWGIPHYGMYFKGGGNNRIMGGPDIENMTGTGGGIALYMVGDSTYGAGNEFHGLRMEGVTQQIQIDATDPGNHGFFGGFTAGPAVILDNGATPSKFYGVYNYRNENWGVATITAGTSVTVNHRLGCYDWTGTNGLTPNVIQITPTSDVGVDVRYWTDTIGATSFAIKTSGTVTKSFYWYAKYQPV